jgi:hypothetical protein
MPHKKRKTQTHRKVMDGELDCTYSHPLWKHVPHREDFDRAEAFLNLIMSSSDARAYRKKLWEQRFQLTHLVPEDILRAARLSLPTNDNQHFSDFAMRMEEDGYKLPPVLLIRGNYQRPLYIAHGYYAICASHYIDDIEMIPAILI